jgi:methionine synthase II (cobalamin-independent)
MEWDDERSGGFEPLRMLPKGKKVVLGMVTTKVGALEKPDDIKRRIDAAAKFTNWISCACHRSAASPPQKKATTLPKTTSGANSK